MTVTATTPTSLLALRRSVREFLAEADFTPICDSWMRGFDLDFTRALGKRGWLGMAVPEEYGGQGRSYVERFVVTEELLRAGAPVAAHWIADRQIAPTLLAHASDRLKDDLLPRICRGEVIFCVGISEPNAGSDVASIATSARRTDEGWVVNGQKIWNTLGDRADYMYLIARTDRSENRHHGLSELVVPMDAPGITVRPIYDLAGEAHFTEVFFDDVVLEDWRLVGEPGAAFKQVVRQLDFERSGPERLLSSYPLFEALVAEASELEDADLATLGRLSARYAALRAMSYSVATAMDADGPPTLFAALTKDLGNELEQLVVDVAGDLLPLTAADRQGDAWNHLAAATTYAPAFTLRGGATEILREIVTRRLLKGVKRS
jgi:alkylation response protein AidB-like acyl-CoA dehydrogenase